MMFGLSLWLFVSLCLDVNGQICQQNKLVSYTALEYDYRWEVETYKDSCWFGSCTKTRRRYRPFTITVIKHKWQYVDACCPGYSNESGDDDDLDCQPTCIPSCMNGFCSSPGVCSCSTGYQSSSNPYHCEPSCSNCTHGDCTAPETCECFTGYMSVQDKFCEPICSNSCENGECVAPDTCECLDGYEKRSDTYCEPHCLYCEEGSHCTAPGICSCDEGYERVDDQCQAICPNGCERGNCTAPDHCECPPAFVLENGTCIPLCPDCANGHCELPFECICDEGYVSDVEYPPLSCRPNCTSDCGPGQCVAPDVCVCDTGYNLTATCDPVCCEPYCSSGCIFGTCTQPEFCLCNFGYEFNYTINECAPKCNYDCGHGECVGPNICNCHYGYGQNETEEFDEPVCKPLCKNCEGVCVSPFNCVCDSNIYTTINVTIDGDDCDCFDDCDYDATAICEKTICKRKDTYHDVYDYDGLGTTTETTEETLSTVSELQLEEHTSGIVHPRTEIYKVDKNDSKTVNSEISQNSNDRNSQTPVWVYYVTAAILIVLVTSIILLLVIKFGYLKTGSYIIDDARKGAPESTRSDIGLIDADAQKIGDSVQFSMLPTM